MSLTLKIVSPREVIYDGSVDFCEIPAESGIEGVLPGHVNFISNVSKGAVKYKIGETVQEIDINGGFVEISNNFINILVND
ncbi:MAG: F0F1 ATP synthase subunit epsilon [Deltaproteobacteria bacterium]|jgi:F-type H+-transporting ATPase subunit epsilon|nr:F0F1 ATP synthase subunit epsilon [Deltaproteobacteria bacterium]MCL5879619.1 F0F1 ATP synthase subunit epsilon [Deltaproteobacteria bacterium]MDA8305026.1 F0F1 ATP synthase subunit epsilon [Deltaproteobacteria bacterium]